MCYVRVKEENKSKITRSVIAMAKLSLAFDITTEGVRRMVKRNDIVLTTPVAQHIITEALGITADELYESEKIAN